MTCLGGFPGYGKPEEGYSSLAADGGEDALPSRFYQIRIAGQNVCSVPNPKVADLGTPRELKAVMHASVRENGPAYWRIARYTAPELFEENHDFHWRTGYAVRYGGDEQ